MCVTYIVSLWRMFSEGDYFSHQVQWNKSVYYEGGDILHDEWAFSINFYCG